MVQGSRNSRMKKAIKYFALFFLVLFLLLLFGANRYVAPMLRQRLHTLIIKGSDSLYTYQLGNLNANFFGGNVEVESLHIRVDSAHYKKLMVQNALPSLTLQLDLQKGSIKGISVFSLLFRKKIEAKEIISNEANIRLTRHLKDAAMPANTLPLWKALQPAIKGIEIDRIHLNGVKMLYKHADTSESVKLQFDRCEALFQNIRIDSAAATDTTRIAFAKNLSMQFFDLKFRTPDSAYKLKAEAVAYNSAGQLLQIKGFKIQSTLEQDEFFKTASFQKSHYEIDVKEASCTQFRLDQFINRNILSADSLVMLQPQVIIQTDKTLPVSPVSKFGQYPHQLLLKSGMLLRIRGVRIENFMISYTEKGAKTGKEGTFEFSDGRMLIANVTNDAFLIKQNAKAIAIADAKIFGSSPIRAKFTFHLNSRNGDFEVEGAASNINASQLNSVAEPLGNAKLQSLLIKQATFRIIGDSYSARGNVRMQYENLAITLRKTDEETGQVKTKKFLSKILNKFAIYPHNPSDGVERIATNVVYARLSTKGFLGIVWKTIFSGMQNIMLKSGHYE